MRRISLLLAVLLSAGCVTSPQSRDGLKETATAHPKMSIAETYVANRSFDSVVTALERKWQECYGVTVTTTRSNKAGMTTSRYQDTFHPQIRRVNNSKVEMTLQMTTKGMVMLNKVPEGGEYMVALDVDRLPGNKTRLSWYSPRWGWTDNWEANKQWADGKNAACGNE